MNKIKRIIYFVLFFPIITICIIVGWTCNTVAERLLDKLDELHKFE